MKSALLLAAAGALLATASPIVNLDKRAPVKTVTEWVYATKVDTAVVTLAPGQQPPGQEESQPNNFPENNDDNTIEEPVTEEPEPEIKAPPPRKAPQGGSTGYQPKPPSPGPSTPPPNAKNPAPPQYGNGPTGGGGGSGNMDDYAKSMLAQHNEARKEHGVPEMRWSSELAQAAQASAQNCIQNHDNGGKGYGQNLAWLWTSGTDDSSTKVALSGVKSWYDEKKSFSNMYGLASPPMANFGDIGHYTEMVWKDTDEVGCATHHCSSSNVEWVTVCNYQKPGNVPGEYAQMVPRPSL